VSILHSFRDITNYFPKFKESRDPEHILSSLIYHACTLCVNQHTKFKVPSFTDSRDMIGAKFKKNRSHDPYMG